MRRIWIVTVIVLAAFFLSACNRLQANYDGLQDDFDHQEQVQDILLKTEESKVVATPEGTSGTGQIIVEPLPIRSPTPTPDPEELYVSTYLVEFISPEYWIIGGYQVGITEDTKINGKIQVDEWAEVTTSHRPGLNEGVIALEIKHKGPAAPEFVGQVYEIDVKQWVVGDFRVLFTNRGEPELGIIGDVQVGDFVRVKGIFVAEGVVGVIQIELIERSEQAGEYFGRVLEKEGYLWRIGEYRVLVDERTGIEGMEELGSLVKVDGTLEPDGSVYADKIQLLEGFPPFPKAEFRGHAFMISPRLWFIGDKTVKTSEYTEITWDIQVDDWVEVSGYFEEYNSESFVIAFEINLIDGPVDDVILAGNLEDMGTSRWVINGQNTQVNRETVIIGDLMDHIHLRDNVVVNGNLREDGVVNALKTTHSGRIVENVKFFARVKQIDGFRWQVGDYDVEVSKNAISEGHIGLDDLVEVQGHQLRDGIIKAYEIKLLNESEPGRELEFTGCLKEMGQLIWLIGDERVLVMRAVEIESDIQIGDLVKVQAFIGDDGLAVARVITLLEQPLDVESTKRD